MTPFNEQGITPRISKSKINRKSKFEAFGGDQRLEQRLLNMLQIRVRICFKVLLTLQGGILKVLKKPYFNLFGKNY